MFEPIERWVNTVAGTTRPDRVVVCDGSDAEHEQLVSEMVSQKVLFPLHASAHPGSYLHRSNPTDVARTEHLTYICSDTAADAGPNNNWMSRADAQERVWPLFNGSMRGRTMYVVPYLMGPLNSPYSKMGVEITDSPYVVANMRIMTHMGKKALDWRDEQGSDEWVPGLHSLGDLSPDRRFIMHFPDTRTIWSVGSGYGGNALLGKKCHALRIASSQARDQGWLAEHMLILGLESPHGDITYIAAAFPSACGKTNLAMLRSPFEDQGWKVHTVGEDIAWLHVGADGRLWAINPEQGYFGVAPGTSSKTNPNAMATVSRNTIFTNVAATDDGRVWWEGMDGPRPAGLTNWRGEAWTDGSGPAAHPNARFTAPASQNPALSPHWQDPQGVPISAILFGGRRARTVPLVAQSFNWEHGVFMGATMASETTAAATGQVGVVRRDPMAMLPFCGYNMGDYWAHWLEVGRAASNPPAIFQVNWFQRDEDGKFLWPGFGENVRVLRWVRDRVRGVGGADETPIGLVPSSGALDTAGLAITTAHLNALTRINREDWLIEAGDQGVFLNSFGDRVPYEIRREHRALQERLSPVRA